MTAQSGSGGTPHPTVATTPSPRSPASRATIDDVSVFALVARHASFVEASRRTGVPTSTVSRAVARLENELGVRLLHRTTRRVALTDEGRALAERVGLHLKGIEDALASIADEGDVPRGLLRVTAPAYTGATRVARALASFAREHPGVTISLDASNVIRDLVDEGFDFGIRVGPVVHADFVARRWWTGHFGLFASRALLRTLGLGAVVTRRALENGPCIVARASARWRFRDAQGQTLWLTPNARFLVSDPRAGVEAARQSLGFVLAPRDAVPPDDPSLVALDTDFGAPEPVDLYVVYPSRRLLPKRVRMAIDWLFDAEAPNRSSRKKPGTSAGA